MGNYFQLTDDYPRSNRNYFQFTDDYPRSNGGLCAESDHAAYTDAPEAILCARHTDARRRGHGKYI